MNAQHALKGFFHRQVRIQVAYPDAPRAVVNFVEDEGEYDEYEAEIKRMIQLQGMVSPQLDAIAIESWD